MEKTKLIDFKKSLARQAIVRRNREVLLAERSINPRSQSIMMMMNESQNVAALGATMDKGESSTNLLASP